jgi:hypothetical protein
MRYCYIEAVNNHVVIYTKTKKKKKSVAFSPQANHTCGLVVRVPGYRS